MESYCKRSGFGGGKPIRGELVEASGRQARDFSNFRCWPGHRYNVCPVLSITSPEVRDLLGHVHSRRVEEEVGSLCCRTRKAKEARGRDGGVRTTGTNANRTRV